jgi:hypothetical protein
MFDLLIHSDWSTDPRKRWMVVAERRDGRWEVNAPEPVPQDAELIEHSLFGKRRVLAGFDFPIGVPVMFGKQTGLNGFVEALSLFGFGEWSKFFEVADRPEDISLQRPFYPRTSSGGSKRAHLFGPLGVTAGDELLRECERETEERRAACPLFWTLGGNQVGKAAIHGWQHVVRPALQRGALLWPFHGRLEQLLKSTERVICETYPREAYGHIGLVLGHGFSKRRQEDRRGCATSFTAWAERCGVSFAPAAEKEVLDGFGPDRMGEDLFDAFVGLLSMIDVVEHRRPEGGSRIRDEIACWEGWILGQGD